MSPSSPTDRLTNHPEEAAVRVPLEHYMGSPQKTENKAR